MKKLTLCLAALALLIPSGAHAAGSFPMPAPRVKTIVVPFSIAGVKRGMTIPAALRAWGQPDWECGGSGGKFATCQWGDAYGSTGQANFGSGVSAKVDAVSIYSRYTAATNVFNGSAVPALKKMKTREGFGLGSPLKAVIRAYPGGKRAGGGSASFVTYQLHKRGSAMTFIAARSTGKIGQINLAQSAGGGSSS